MLGTQNWQNEFLQFFDHEPLLPYCEKLVEKARNTKETFQLGFGCNFYQDQLKNFKVYSTWYKKPSREELEFFLPRLTEFDEWIPKWQPSGSRHADDSGCCFGLKVDRNLVPTHQFHFRTPGHERLQDFKWLKPDRPVMVNRGYSFEYSAGEVVNKEYFYSHDPNMSRALSELYKIQFSPMGMIDYAETEKNYKVIQWTSDQRMIDTCFSTEPWPNMKSFIEFISKEFSMMPTHPGIYGDGQTRAIYFLPSNDPIRHSVGRFESFNEFVQKIKTLKMGGS